MCGIAAMVNNQDEAIDPLVLKRMIDVIPHRGPDGEGTYIDSSVGLAHKRLSILDLSDQGRQPMRFRGYTITYNGEIYNYLELREELQNLGHEFRSTSDTEVVLAAYAEWGTECVKRFNGMWAFVLLDPVRKVLFCSRDRFGIKPLNYAVSGNLFLVSSEIKQMAELSGFSLRLAVPTMVRFLALGLLNTGDDTFFDAVYSLPGGHNLIYDLRAHTFSTNAFYDINNTCRTPSITPQEAQEEFRRLFHDSLKLRMRSDVPVGSCLSGGLDSSSIVCGIRHFLNDDLVTVTSCYEDKKYDEREYSRLVSEMTGFTGIETFPDLSDLYSQDLFDRIVYSQDQPIPSGSHFAEYKVFESAGNSGFKVMLDGQGSDEYLAGYGEFIYARCSELIRSGHFLQATTQLRRWAGLRDLKISRSVRHMLSLAYRTVRPRAADVRFPDWLDPICEPFWRDDDRRWNALLFRRARDVDSLSRIQLQSTSIPYQLHSEDRNAMLHSVESRLPFLDYRLVEFALGLPSQMKIHDGVTKVILREALNEILPDGIRNRISKMGFVSPDENWMRKSSDVVRPELVKAVVTLKGVVNENLIRRYDAFADGRGPYDSLFFRCLSAGRFMNIFGLMST